jgi:quercetin dioxygenase-like cupin family protein
MRFALALLIAAVAPAGAAAPVPAPLGEVRVDVPRGRGPQQVVAVERVFPVGGESGWHVHPGIEMGRVISGVTEMRSAGEPPRRYAAGESFVIPRGTVHNGVNAGAEPARLAITYVLDRGAPIRIPASPPPDR